MNALNFDRVSHNSTPVVANSLLSYIMSISINFFKILFSQIALAPLNVRNSVHRSFRVTGLLSVSAAALVALLVVGPASGLALPSSRCTVGEEPETVICDRTCATTLRFLQTLRGAGQLRGLVVTGHRMDEVAEDALTAVATLERLSLRGNRLRHWHPRALEPLQRLQGLDVARNALAELVLDACPPALAALDASANALRALRLAPCAALRRLDLRGNRLSRPALDDALAPLPTLTHLDASGNPLGDALPASLRRLPVLQDLRLSHCGLSALPPDAFAGTPLLTDLRLDGNRLTHVDGDFLAPLGRLRTLDLSYNALTAFHVPLPAAAPLSITHLNLSSNAIGNQLDFLRYLPELRVLKMDNCSVSNLHHNVFKDNPNAENLSFDENLLSHVDPLVFSNLSSLRMILIRRNNLKFIDLSPLIAENTDVYLDGNVFERLELSATGRMLHLTSNQLGRNLSFLARGERLLDLRLANNNITKADPRHFEPLQNLRRLCIENNSISDISFVKHLTELRVLNLSSNSISSIPSDVFSNKLQISIIYLSDNFISSPDFLRNIPPQNMKFLRLSNNRLQTIGKHFTAWNKLEYLHLDRNNISSIDTELSSLKSLKELDIRFNNITYLHPKVFERLPIKTLFLDGNKFVNTAFLERLENLEMLNISGITTYRFKDRDFSHLQHLKTLSVRENGMKSIDFVEHFPELETLDVSGNNITFVREDVFREHCKLKTVVLERNPFSGDFTFISSAPASVDVVVWNGTFQDLRRSKSAEERVAGGSLITSEGVSESRLLRFSRALEAFSVLFSLTYFQTVRLFY